MNQLNIKIQVILVGALLILPGCQLTPARQTSIAQADYGPYPTNYEDIVKQYFGQTLFGPFTAHYNIGTPTQGYSRHAPITGGGPDQFGFLIDVGVNAKNRMGGYVGEVKYRLLFRNGQVAKQWQLPWPSE